MKNGAMLNRKVKLALKFSGYNLRVKPTSKLNSSIHKVKQGGTKEILSKKELDNLSLLVGAIRESPLQGLSGKIIIIKIIVFTILMDY